MVPSHAVEAFEARMHDFEIVLPRGVNSVGALYYVASFGFMGGSPITIKTDWSSCELMFT